MGCISDEGILRAEQLVQFRCHRVERLGETADLGGPLRGCTGGEISAADGVGSALQAIERACDPASEDGSDSRRDSEDDGRDDCKNRPVAVNASIHCRRRIANPDGAMDDPARGDRDGDVEQVGAKRSRGARACSDLAVQGAHDLRTRREVRRAVWR